MIGANSTSRFKCGYVSICVFIWLAAIHQQPKLGGAFSTKSALITILCLILLLNHHIYWHISSLNITKSPFFRVDPLTPRFLGKKKRMFHHFSLRNKPSEPGISNAKLR
jgi:hypothetical protein